MSVAVPHWRASVAIAVQAGNVTQAGWPGSCWRMYACMLATWAAGVMEFGVAAGSAGVGAAVGGVGDAGASRLRAAVKSLLCCGASW